MGPHNLIIGTGAWRINCGGRPLSSSTGMALLNTQAVFPHTRDWLIIIMRYLPHKLQRTWSPIKSSSIGFWCKGMLEFGGNLYIVPYKGMYWTRRKKRRRCNCPRQNIIIFLYNCCWSRGSCKLGCMSSAIVFTCEGEDVTGRQDKTPSIDDTRLNLFTIYYYFVHKKREEASV